MTKREIKQLENKIGVAIKIVPNLQSDFAFNTDPITTKQKTTAQKKLRELGYEFMQLRTGTRLSKRVWVKPESVKRLEILV